MEATIFWFIVGIILLLRSLWALPPIQAKIPTQEGKEPYHGQWSATIRRAIGCFICFSIAQHAIPLSAEEQARIDAECRSMLECWHERYRFAAENACTSALEARAKYDFQWTDTWSERKFDEKLTKWKDQDKGHLTYFGDKLRLQNGFGAFQTVLYRCDYDGTERRVLDTRIASTEEGILELYVDK